MSCGDVEDFNLHRFLQHQLRVRAPALCASTSLCLLDPIKSGLRNPTLRSARPSLHEECRIECHCYCSPPTVCPSHLQSAHTLSIIPQATTATSAQPIICPSRYTTCPWNNHLLTHSTTCLQSHCPQQTKPTVVQTNSLSTCSNKDLQHCS